MDNTSENFQFVSVGNTTIDTFLKIGEDKGFIFTDEAHPQEQVCFEFGDKIDVENKVDAVGGNGANAGATAVSLGLRTAVWSTIGNDSAGKQAVEQLQKKNISTDYIHIDPNRKTDTSIILSYQNDRTIFAHREPHILRTNDLPETQWAYISTIANQWEEIYPVIVKWVSDNNIKVVYQPGYVQRQFGLEKSRALLEKTELLIMNKEEAIAFAQIQNSKFKVQNDGVASPQLNIKELLQEFLNYGPKIAVITDGENGSYAMDSEFFYSTGVEDIPIVEKTGAGDAYSSAFACALIYEKNIEEAMKWGILNAQSVIGKIGAQEGILTKDELEAKRASGEPRVEIRKEAI